MVDLSSSEKKNTHGVKDFFLETLYYVGFNLVSWILNLDRDDEIGNV